MVAQERRMNGHVAKRWVEAKFPETRGPMKAMMIMAFGAGVDAGFAEAQDIVNAGIAEIKKEWGIK